jgi:hypothetical protein
MAVESQTGTAENDNNGLIDAIDNDLSFAEKLVNLQLNVKDEMTVRPGLVPVVFEAD